MIINDSKNYTGFPICKECGGYCCKKCPGDFSPDDFGSNREEIYNNILNGLTNGVLTFHTRLIYRDYCKDDYITKCDSAYCSHDVITIRPVTKPKKSDGECIFLSKDGCELSFDKRPLLCKSLIPGKKLSDRCLSRIPAVNITLEWIGYEDMMSCLKSIDRKMRRSRRKPISTNLYKSTLPEYLCQKNDGNKKLTQELPY